MDDWSKYEPRFRYMMLDRLRQDCQYYLGYGGRNPNSLWAGNEKDQIENMKTLWNTFPKEDTPEWLTWDDILEFQWTMCGYPKYIKTHGGYIGVYAYTEADSPVYRFEGGSRHADKWELEHGSDSIEDV